MHLYHLLNKPLPRWFSAYRDSTSSARWAILRNMIEIVQDGAKVLRGVAKPVSEKLFGSVELAHIIEDMTEALDAQPEGVALAAPQLGVPYRLFIVRKDRTLPSVTVPKGAPLPPPPPVEVEIYINPEVVKTSRRKEKVDEGCLSVRGVYGTTKRHERVTVRARRASGESFERGGGGIIAQIFEHEIDHLNGVLFTDNAEHLIHITHARPE